MTTLTPVRCVVAGEIAVDLDVCNELTANSIAHRLSLPNPKYASGLAFGLAPGTLDEIPRTIECSRVEAGWLFVPRGAADIVRGELMRRGQAPAWEDRRVTGDPLMFSTLAGFVPRDYQAAAVDALTDGVQGVWEAPCGAGKTKTSVSVIARLGLRTVILVHTKDLMSQWKRELAATLACHDGVDMMPSVMMVQSLAALPRRARREHLRHYGVCILDEAHHAPADTFREVLADCPARYRFGLTATPEREDGLTELLWLVIGPKLHTTDRTGLIDAGHLLIPEIVRVETGFMFTMRPQSPKPKDPKAGALWRRRLMRNRAADRVRCEGALSTDTERNRIILDAVENDYDDGHTILVLSGRVEHCNVLGAELEKRGVRAKVLTAKTPKKVRAEIVRALHAGDIRCVVATAQLADEGLDAPRLDRMHMAFPFKAEGRAIQRVGRLQRPHPGKGTPVLYDYVDVCVDLPVHDETGQTDHVRKPYDEMFKARSKAYRKAIGE